MESYFRPYTNIISKVTCVGKLHVLESVAQFTVVVFSIGCVDNSTFYYVTGPILILQILFYYALHTRRYFRACITRNNDYVSVTAMIIKQKK